MYNNKPLSSIALLILVSGQLLPQIDFSIVNTALSAMGQSLHSDQNSIISIVAFYGLSFAITIIPAGYLGDRYGRKRLFMIGITGFCIASTVCGMANSIDMMLLGRIAQGIFGALLMPQILATIHDTLEGERHARAVAIYTSISGISFVLGQILGGLLISENILKLNWRIAFFINIPISIIILIISAFAIPETYSKNNKKFDMLGLIFFSLLLLSLLIPITLSEYSPLLWLLLFFIFPLGFYLWEIEKHKESLGMIPFIPPSLFNVNSISTGFLAVSAVTFSFPAFVFVVALCLQNTLHFTSLQSAVSFVSIGCLFFIGSILSKRISFRIGNYTSYVFGACLAISGLILTICLFWKFKDELAIYHLVIATGIIGFGNALMLTAGYKLVLEKVGKQQSGIASSLLITLRQTCFAIGTACIGQIYILSLKFGYLIAITTSIGTLILLLLIVSLVMLRKRNVIFKKESVTVIHQIN